VKQLLDFITRQNASSNIQKRPDNLFVSHIQACAIDFKKDFRDRRCYTFIAVNEGVSLREVISVGGGASPEVSILVILTILSSSQRRFQRALVP